MIILKQITDRGYTDGGVALFHQTNPNSIMGFKPLYTKADIRKRFAQATQNLQAGIIQVLSYLGELCVNHARTLNTYKDQTGNLRASIGYIIVKDGKVIKQSFEGAKAEGKQRAREVAKELMSQIEQGWALIVVAGMNYALAVESRGLDVLTSAEQLAKSELPGLLKQLKADVVSPGK